MAERNWHRISEAPLAIGPLLVCVESGPAFIGYQAPDGRWFDQTNTEVRPAYYCEIPAFDADDEATS